MITKDQFLANLLRECNICKHLVTKLTPESYDYRPSESQRSTIELLRYLAICGIAGTRSMASGDWGVWKEYSERVKELTPEEFPHAMDQQIDELKTFFASISEETLETQQAVLPWKETVPLGAALLAGPFKWITAYKMQLFLYAKANGAAIGTANAWAGADSIER